MKCIFVLAVLPLMLFALEKVNLIKDHSFEKNSDAWMFYAKTRSGKDLVPTAVSKHDSTKAFSGLFSAYCDTRTAPSPQEVDSAVAAQGLVVPKIMGDLDTLIVNYSITPIMVGSDLYYNWMHGFNIILYVTDPSNTIFRYAVYILKCPDQNPTTLPPRKALMIEDFTEDTLWHSINRNVKLDLTGVGFSNETIVDSIYFIGWGAYYPPWRGLKASFDDIRLTGYADYDVGVKSLLSGDSVWKETGYTPTARIKNFGRKPADSFLLIAEIKGGSGVVYADTLNWSLTADTEDTVSFKEFKPSDALDYTLTVSTLMTPDESDEDDVMSKTLYGSGVEEQLIPAGLAFEVSSFTASPKVSYSLLLGEKGTISLYDPTGRRIESLTVTGSGSVNFKSNHSSGVYFIKLETGKASVTRKAVVLR